MSKHTETTDRLAARALRNNQQRGTSDYRHGYAEGLMVAWEIVTGNEDATNLDAMREAAERHRVRQSEGIAAYRAGQEANR